MIYIVKPTFLAILVVVGLKGVYIAPRAPPRPQEKRAYGKEDLIEKFLRWGLPVSQIALVSLAACETAVLLARQYPGPISDAVLRFLVYASPSSVQSIAMTPTFLVGWGMAVAGALIRMHCYRVLGLQYTFERAVIKEHNLITTGPYAIVRHPAYTGFEMFKVGILVAQLGKGSWVWECGVFDTWAGRALVGAWILYVYKLVAAVFRRCSTEDEALRKEFGDKWVGWAQKTPSRLIPGIY